MKYRALLMKYRALLMEYRALLKEYRAPRDGILGSFDTVQSSLDGI